MVGAVGPSWPLAVLVMVAAVVGSAVTVHHEVDGDLFTWGMVEGAVGLAAGIPGNGWRMPAFAVGVAAGYGLIKMRRRPVRALTNAAFYVTAAGCALLVVEHSPLATVPAVGRGAAAAVITSLVVFALASATIRYAAGRPWRAALRVGFAADLVHAVIGAVVGGMMAELVATDPFAAVVAVAALACAAPVLHANLAARAESRHLRQTLQAATRLLTFASVAEVQAVLADAASELVGRPVHLVADVPAPAATATALSVAVPTSGGPRLALVTDDGRGFELHPSPRTTLAALAACAGAALDSARQRQEWRDLADRDPLTGLLNRRALHAVLSRQIAAAAGSCVYLTVAYLDLNGFKQVNDRHGHAVGDDLLVAVSEGLRAATRQHDHAARLGGDEFCVVLVDRTTPPEPSTIAARFRATIHEAAGTTRHPVTVSIGIAQYPTEAADLDDLLRLADNRMYADKRHSQQRGERHARGCASTHADI